MMLLLKLDPLFGALTFVPFVAFALTPFHLFEATARHLFLGCESEFSHKRKSPRF